MQNSYNSQNSEITHKEITNNQADLIKSLYEILYANFSGSVNIIDDSHLHAGHNHNGGGHYTLHIVDEKFTDLSRIQRHRLVYDILEQYMQGKIHALALKLYSPYEYFNEN